MVRRLVPVVPESKLKRMHVETALQCEFLQGGHVAEKLLPLDGRGRGGPE